MSRNLRNELVVAIVAFLFVMLVFAFAILLSERITDDVEMTETQIARSFTATSMIQGTSTVVPSRTFTLIAPLTLEASNTSQPSETPTATVTTAPSDTPTGTVTTAPSNTPTRTDTRTPTDTPTTVHTPTAVPTNTPLRPSATAFVDDSNIPQPTRYVPRPTFTPFGTPVATTTPTDRASLSSDSNPVLPINTLTTPPATPTVAPGGYPSRPSSNCERPLGWAVYVVVEGNTLYAISLATGSSVDELRAVNCIEDVDLIQTGDRLFVPRLPDGPVLTMVPRRMRAGLGAIGCFDGVTTITSPIVGQRLAGSFTIFGSAHRADFAYYKIEIRPDFAPVYDLYAESDASVQSGALGEVNAAIFGSGLHWLRLSVVNSGGRIPSEGVCEIPVVFE